MNLFKKLTAAVAVVALLGVSACQFPSTGTALTSVVTSVTGQSLVTALLTGIMPQLDSVIAKGATLNAADLQLVAYWAPWAETAVNVIGPFVPGMTQADITATDQIITDLAASASAQNPNTATVVAEAATLVKDLQNLVSSVTAAKAAAPAS